MQLLDLIHRTEPEPWTEAENLPWNEPGFSLRMLEEHLSQAHDAASRRAGIIDRHVAFLHELGLNGKPGRVLDMTCGPGLYTERLARLGHICRGIDYSPASINYARRQAEREQLDCSYVLSDVRVADFQAGWDLAMLIYGEFNTFRPADARRILIKAHQALRRGGSLVLEPSSFEQIRQMGLEKPSWASLPGGLFAAAPYLQLFEAFWREPARVATNRWYIVDAASGALERYSSSYQAYTVAEFADLLRSCGFADIQFFATLEKCSAETPCALDEKGAQELDEMDNLIAILAKKW